MTKHRCGWCITGAHGHCLVVLEMEVKKMPPYFWYCECWVEDCPNDRDRTGTVKCVDCQRKGVGIVNNRCLDPADCRSVVVKPKPAPIYSKDYS